MRLSRHFAKTLATTQQHNKKRSKHLSNINVRFCGFKVVFGYLFIFLIIAIIIASHEGDVAISIKTTFSDLLSFQSSEKN